MQTVALLMKPHEGSDVRAGVVLGPVGSIFDSLVEDSLFSHFSSVEEELVCVGRCVLF